MQQQMFDQFQQAMGMLVQMFGTMHREQMEVIREELDRLHDLTRELQELKQELARSPGPAAAPTVPVAEAGAARRPATAPADVPATGIPGPAAAGAAGQRRPMGPLTAPPPPPTAPRPDQSLPGAGSPGRIVAPVLAGTGQDAVAWIHQRIAAI